MLAGTVETRPGHATITALEDASSVWLSWEAASVPGAAPVRMLDDRWLGDVWGDEVARFEIDVSAWVPSARLSGPWG